MVRMTMKISMQAILANKLRSLLTMLGIIIGVMSVIILVSIGRGTQTKITNSISNMGSNLLTATVTNTDDSVNLDDVENLTSYSSISAVAPVVSTNATVKSGSTSYSTTVMGVTQTYGDVYNSQVQSGRKIVASDLEWRTHVCVIGTDVATEIFDSWDVIGKTLTVGDGAYTIVGLLKESGSSTYGSRDDIVLIPLTMAQRMTGSTGITQFYASAASADSVTQSKNIIESFLLSETRDDTAYTVYSQSEILSTMSSVADTFFLMLGGIAAISLLVGGIGIMNIMLVSVNERTREIGIRKSIGAKRRHILGQFLAEACVLSIIGGLLGVALSFLGIQLYNMVTSMSIQLNTGIAAAAIAFCAIIGIAFGSYPAAKASKLTPIEALRYTS